jgi:hypothetical protein
MSVALATVNDVPEQQTELALGGTAPLKNITLMLGLVNRLQRRAPGLPGLGCFSAPSGFGKSFASAHAAGQFRAYYVEIRSSWTRKALTGAILRQMGIVPAKTVYEQGEQIAEQLALSHRPLILDEVDHAVDRGLIETIRDIYEQSQASIILVGEEMLPTKLQRWERFHGRILEWVQAAACDLSDAQQLARLYCPRVTIEDDLLTMLVTKAHGSVRRVVVNIDRIREHAHAAGLRSIGLADWADRPLYTGDAPRGRSF